MERAIRQHEDGNERASLVVGWQGGWIEKDGRRIDLGSRAPLRRLVWELALRRILEPGLGADIASLVDATWPGERLRADSAAHRLHVALSTLRRLGLRDAIDSDGEGYRLAPGSSIRLSLQS